MDNKTIKEVFNIAKQGITEKRPFMCTAIDAIGFDSTHFAEYGFTKETYHKFIREHYPVLIPALNVPQQSSVWIMISRSKEDSEITDLILRSKKAFLQYLSTQL